MVTVTRNPKLEKEKKIVVDLGVAVNDELVIPKEYVDYLKNRMKINGIKGNTGEDVAITYNKGIVKVTSKVQIPKRYIKYLTKKYLRKIEILEFFRLLASDKQSYRLVYNDYDKPEAEEEN